jgi:hypothetical protein
VRIKILRRKSRSAIENGEIENGEIEDKVSQARVVAAGPHARGHIGVGYTLQLPRAFTRDRQ